MTGGAGGGGSSLGPDSATFETGVREGDGAVTFTTDTEWNEECEVASSPQPDPVVHKSELPATGGSLTTLTIGAGFAVIAGIVTLLFTRRRAE